MESKLINLISKAVKEAYDKAKAALKDKGIGFEEVVLGTDATSVTLKAVSGQTTVPQIFVDGQHLGDSEAAIAYAKK